MESDSENPLMMIRVYEGDKFIIAESDGTDEFISQGKTVVEAIHNFADCIKSVQMLNRKMMKRSK
jgi:molybdopterin/thiamine biosynthesis adenylyltransferase